jgi:hypothetical protein
LPLGPAERPLGVGSRLFGHAWPGTVLLGVGMQTFLAEWPVQWSGASAASQFAPHVSNADLVAAMIAGWFTGARLWRRASMPQ